MDIHPVLRYSLPKSTQLLPPSGPIRFIDVSIIDFFVYFVFEEQTCLNRLAISRFNCNLLLPTRAVPSHRQVSLAWRYICHIRSIHLQGQNLRPVLGKMKSNCQNLVQEVRQQLLNNFFAINFKNSLIKNFICNTINQSITEI
ncbi:hypothetical protein DUNSADRAFT_8257 [Dunaliella salina]|uniref:Encoded protein n=1 Tax=Dunaliella salina TaxID=3046 RepID=A0ABQ7HA64_DUNSA|nr:hypothetical protein DUNSADRAFT_8257 [Dunaliella salina]|eukprot:KAF5843741.1 hypothetical protein DUNSADRAFT_8257 [Dunaliella salina]